MTKEDLKSSILQNDKNKILANLSEIWKNETLDDECFSIVLDLLYSSEDKEILNQVDWSIYFSMEKNSMERALKIIQHEKYTYEKIKLFKHIHDAIFHNSEISTMLYKTLILLGTERYYHELMQLLDSVKIDLSTLNLTIDEKITIFYKSMGVICAHIKQNMLICFNLLEDDKLLQKDENLLITFVRFFGWNWMGTST